ncbi:MAG: 4-hydroxy-3-methylbut-2-enyl diphosphate reductase [Bacteroidetes bacterium]|nr:4-hydroxy-3-methylbut-2-enyl diphosphate reductase [Bacteroidota bacterium]
MEVHIDRNSGFCWGVVRAVDFAEEELGQNAELYSLGDIIHNPMEIERLGEKGLKTIHHEDFERIAQENATKNVATKILIRAHGEPPKTYEDLKRLGIEVIDATCPVVTKVQERIKKFYDKGYQIVIFGKRDHAEVIGLRGVVNDEAIVVKTLAEATEKVTLDKPTVLFSQTTMDKPTFYAIRDELKGRLKELVIAEMEEDAVEFHAKDTICGQVSGREKKLIEFAKANDVIVFVAGRTSSNGKVLHDIAKSVNPRVYFAEKEEELQSEWFAGASTVGITGATSTPMWLMERVSDAIYKMVGEPEKASLLPVVA